MTVVTDLTMHENDMVPTQKNYYATSVQVNSDQVSADENGRKIIPAGTPLGANDDALTKAETVLDIGNSNNTQGVARHDIDVTNGQINATLMVSGIVNLRYVDNNAKQLITDSMKKQLNHIIFIDRN